MGDPGLKSGLIIKEAPDESEDDAAVSAAEAANFWSLGAPAGGAAPSQGPDDGGGTANADGSYMDELE